MNIKHVKSRMDELSHLIDWYNQKYYVENEPCIADAEYDALLKELIALEEQYPDLKDPDSPTQRIGAKIDGALPSVAHQVKMLSLDNTYSTEDLRLWDERVRKGLDGAGYELNVELKIDGASCALIYEEGRLVLGVTRGDGMVGEDVTHNVKTMQAVPLKLKGKFPRLLEVRGEVYMDKQDFIAVNQERKTKGEDVFANPRNAAAGALKLLDSRLTRARRLKFFAHSFGRVEGEVQFKTHEQFLETIKFYGLPVNGHNRLCGSIEEVIGICQNFEEQRAGLDYEVDGVVIKVNDFNEQAILGTTLKSPRWAVAFKFQAYQATTTVNKIVVQVGRTGVLTPVAELEPVPCGGVLISRATLHNFDEISRLGVNAGDRVLIERAGDVIPKIVKVVEKLSVLGKFSVPQLCPACGSKIVKEKSEDVAYRCDNLICPKQIERRIIHFASRGAMDIEGLGEVVVEQLLNKGLVKNITSIYYLRKDDLLQLELSGDKKADNLLKAIEQSKQRPLSKLLFGLGINNIGEKAALTLAEQFKTLDALADASIEDIEAVNELGPVMAQSIVSFFQSQEGKGLCAGLKVVGVNMVQPETTPKGNRLKSKKFVFTGELDGLSRQEAGRMVVAEGGVVVGSVSKATDYVVVGDKPGSKFKEANQLGVKVLNQKQFMEVLHG